MTEQAQVLIHQLLDDINVLKLLTPENGRPSPEMTRTAIAPILRRWICDQLFHQVQRLLRQKIIRFEIWENKQAVENCAQGYMHHWLSMINLGTFLVGAGLPKEQFIAADGKWTFPMGEASKVRYPSHKFFNQIVIYWNGRSYRRIDILRHLANKLGGVHLDFHRKPDEEDINDVAHHFGFEIVENNHKMMMAQDLREAKSDRARRGRTYDAMELVAIDTARAFAAGVDEATPELLRVLRT